MARCPDARGRRPSRTATLAAACALTALAPGVARGQQAAKTTWDRVFTAEQAGRGGEIYGGMCASCHGPQLEGIDAAPALNGGAFFANWNGVSIADMVDRVRISMPANAPGVMSRQQVVDVLAYVFSRNGMPAGSTELPRQSARLLGIVFRPQRGR